ncbi:hypothetical protein ZIOFF_038273 [Zingiber officinale]|uniref:Uncharacterized protein n=1 Tax=Zingiber officinale TaxID=94328 RepID=A0A8J5G8I7_ZINOF|nr:hypothetical protein ZIOFF_038273 [Zingiber officinale]
MGNGLSRKRKIVKVMKLDGSTLKFKSPVRAAEVLEEYPGYNLLDSDDVTRSGIRAQPLEKRALLKPGKLYFLIQLPRRPLAVAADPRSLMMNSSLDGRMEGKRWPWQGIENKVIVGCATSCTCYWIWSK